MIRSTLKRGLKKVLGREDAGPPRDRSVESPNWQNRSPDYLEPKAAAPAAPEAVAAPPQAAPPQAAEPEVAEPEVAEPEVVEPQVAETAAAEPEVAETATAETATAMDASDDTAGEPLTMEAVQEILDDMVRPALQGDGGDITLLRIEDNNIYVKLVGACNTCPSSIMTMKMGVEALLKEEFPMMAELIQEEAGIVA